MGILIVQREMTSGNAMHTNSTSRFAHLPGDSPNTGLNESYSALLRENLPVYNGSRPDNVELFRLRKVDDSTGQTLFDNATGPGISWAADAIVKYPIFGFVCKVDNSTTILPGNIIDGLSMAQPDNQGRQIQFHAPGANVTTGVAVILTGHPKSNCKRPTVYCNLVTPCKVFQFSSKGCPSYPCTCATPASQDVECTDAEKK
ncbi:uncharacterized protein LOC129587780 [Paramacrobiotus metropolitanus]|uniref:uncharacterized protein LOC129587780 n=1 Tax=Paramacrobiotus metropolitanus TaxID=2943436 RepID=UPI002445CFA8|nr:uncharacterized protein LOC129587780 [Paramacrobiotus metropolitanus]